MYLNKAYIIGNITRDPELKAIPSGIKVCSFSVATNRVWKDKNGARQEVADYHNIVVFGNQAETVAQYMKKGSQVFVDGRLQTRSWEKDGQKMYRTEIVADRIQFGQKLNGSKPTRNEKEDAGIDTDEELDTVDYPEEDGLTINDIPF